MSLLVSNLEIASFTPYPIKHHPIEISLNKESMAVLWDNHHRSEYHYLWLRNNCYCQEIQDAK